MPFIFRNRAGGGNAAESFYADNGAHAWWMLRETQEPYLDGGVNSYDMVENVSNSVPWFMPGLTRGVPRNGGLYVVDGTVNVGTVNAVGGPGALGWTTGGMTAAVLLSKDPTNNNQFVVYETYYQDTSLDNVRVQIDLNRRLHFRVQAGASFIDVFTGIGAVPLNTPASIAVFQNADGNGVRMYVDGVEEAVTHTFSGGLDLDDWVDAVFADDGADVNADETLLGYSSQVRSNRGIISAPAVWRNSALDPAGVLEFHDSLNLTGTATDWGELVLEYYADARMGLFPIGGIFQVINQMFSFGTNGEPQAVASNPNMIFGDNILVSDYNLNAFRFDSSSFEPRLREAAVTPGEMGPDGSETEGTLTCVFTVLSVLNVDDPQYIFGWGASDILDNSTWAGLGAYLDGDDSNATLYVYWRVNTSKSLYRINGVGDHSPGDLVHLTIQQPDDGGGPLFWINGVVATGTEVVTEGAGITNEWFADLFTGYPGTPGWAWGSDGFDQRFLGYGHALLVTNDLLSQADIDAHQSALTGGLGANGHIGTFDDLIATLNPIIEYRFDEVSGALLNHGSGSGEDLPVILEPTTRQVPNLDYSVTTGLMANVVDTDGWGRAAAFSTNWQRSSGTLIVAFQQTGAQTVEDKSWSMENDAGFFKATVGLQVGGGIFFELHGQPSSVGGIITGPLFTSSGLSGGMILVVVRQAADGGGPEMFVNGRSYGKGNFLSNGQPNWWFINIYSSATKLAMGGTASVGAGTILQGINGNIDRWVLTDTIMTDDQITRLSQYYGVR